MQRKTLEIDKKKVGGRTWEEMDQKNGQWAPIEGFRFCNFRQITEIWVKKG